MPEFKEFNESKKVQLEEASNKYQVVVGDANSEGWELQNCKTPKEAITKWINAQGYDSMNANIDATSDAAVKEFYDWIFNNLDWFAKAINKQKAYKPNFLYTQVQTINVQKASKDNLEPFTRG